MTRLILVVPLILLFGCKTASVADKSFSSTNLIIQKVTNKVYQHTTFLDTQRFGRVPCNGMIVYDSREAIVFDTPPDDSTSAALIDWITTTLGCKVIAIIPTHFHEDCLGGLREFHRRGIPSYAENRTIQLARSANFPVPQNGFDQLLELRAGRRKVVAEFVGEGHTRDNVIGYVPSEKVMFGGCLIKELNAAKGNLADANVAAWPTTATKLKQKYPDAQVVIPGHGQSGTLALVDYTIKLFEPKQ